MGVKRIIEILTIFKTDMKGITSAFKETNQQFKKHYKKSGELKKSFTGQAASGKKLGVQIRNLTNGMKGFKMEALGVMFFGMSMMHFFSNLLKPAMDLVGIFDIMNVTLGVVFLPIALALLDALLPLMDFFLNMSPTLQLALSVFVSLGAVLGIVLFVVGSIVLGIGSLILMFGSVGGAVAVISGVFWGLLGIFGILGVAIAAMVILWQSDIGGFQSFIKNTFGIIATTIGGVFDGVKKIFEEAFGFITAFLSGDMDDAWNHLKNMGLAVWDTLKIAFLGFGAVLYNTFVWAINAIKDLIFDVLLGSILKIVELVYGAISHIPGLKDFGQTASDYAAGYREMIHQNVGGGTQVMNYITAGEIANATKVQVDIKTDTDLTYRATGG